MGRIAFWPDPEFPLFPAGRFSAVGLIFAVPSTWAFNLLRRDPLAIGLHTPVARRTWFWQTDIANPDLIFVAPDDFFAVWLPAGEALGAWFGYALAAHQPLILVAPDDFFAIWLPAGVATGAKLSDAAPSLAHLP